MTDRESHDLTHQTLNCISEEMYEISFKDAIKMVSVSYSSDRIFEWRWLDEQGTVKIPYHITFTIKSELLAGLYSRWRTKDRSILLRLQCSPPGKDNYGIRHNNKKRMPVFIAKKMKKHG